VANWRILQRTPFKDIFIQPAAGDDGAAVGVAFYIYNTLMGNPRSYTMEHAYLGPQFSNEEIESFLRARGVRYEACDRQRLLERTAQEIAGNKVVGWFQGRMEFGARALGNRSLLADPRRDDMRDIINLRIKFREKFRPFAPSILEDHVGKYFEIDAPAPFMEKVFHIRPEKRSTIPAVTHVDGTGRLQTVSRETNPLYCDLIKAFADRTGEPVLLNTSLNENEPIVNTPDEALKCMLRTRMDAMALGPYYVERPAAALSKVA
jgi:carbamoyltransferase